MILTEKAGLIELTTECYRQKDSDLTETENQIDMQREIDSQAEIQTERRNYGMAT